MENDSKQVCLNNKDIHLADIAKKVFDKKRITPEDGLYLFEHFGLLIFLDYNGNAFRVFKLS